MSYLDLFPSLKRHEKLRAIDPRSLERMPLSLFPHVCCNHLNLQVAEIARQNGQNVLNARTNLRDALPDYQCLPLPIVDYITHISNVLTPSGVEVKLNLPQIAIPQGPINNVASGTFGPVNALIHNVYEAYISQLVISNRVIASQQNNPDYAPLPAELIPANLIPNRNLLGFEPIDIQNADILQTSWYRLPK